MYKKDLITIYKFLKAFKLLYTKSLTNYNGMVFSTNNLSNFLFIRYLQLFRTKLKYIKNHN